LKNLGAGMDLIATLQQGDVMVIKETQTAMIKTTKAIALPEG
jgi:dUTPase